MLNIDNRSIFTIADKVSRFTGYEALKLFQVPFIVM